MATQSELDSARAALHDLMTGNALRRYRKMAAALSLLPRQLLI